MVGWAGWVTRQNRFKLESTNEHFFYHVSKQAVLIFLHTLVWLISYK